MKATLEEIYQDPTVLGRAIESGEVLEIVEGETVQATLRPKSHTPSWWTPGGEWPDFAKRREELRKLGMRRLTPEEQAEFDRLLRSDRDI